MGGGELSFFLSFLLCKPPLHCACEMFQREAEL